MWTKFVLFLKSRLRTMNHWEVHCGIDRYVDHMGVREMHLNRASSNPCISPMEVKVGLGAEETNVAIRHAASHRRDEDWMPVCRSKLPHDGPNP
jgi:hypothetical protein